MSASKPDFSTAFSAFSVDGFLSIQCWRVDLLEVHLCWNVSWREERRSSILAMEHAKLLLIVRTSLFAVKVYTEYNGRHWTLCRAWVVDGSPRNVY